MNIAYSNLLATIAVICLPVIGRVWIASTSTRRLFYALTLWGIPFLAGQYAQEDKWGSLWVQYHLLDLSYAPWGTALMMCLLSAPIGKALAANTLFRVSFVATVAFGYVSELWDTLWSWNEGRSLLRAIDLGDYTTITAGVIAVIIFYTWSQRTTSRVITS